ncbi:MAG: PP2C family protein-serine/threonine phosphatase [Planctomycetota bacterium JB042]
MAAKKRRGDSTIIAKPGAGRDKISATQILSAAQVRAAKKGGGRAGDSSVIMTSRIRRSGLSISVKFALAISTAIAIFMALFGVVVLNNVKGSLNEEIDAAGILAARVLATHELFTWDEFHGAFTGTSYARWEQEIASGDRKVPRDALTDDEWARVQERRESNRALLDRLIESDGRILDAVIFNVDRTRIIRVASGRPKLDFAGSRVYEKSGVDVEYGTFDTPGGEALAARSFVAPILGQHGDLQGKATVVLSEESIQNELAKVRMQVLVLALVFIALGVGVSFIMGTQITSPISQLTRDVEVIAKGHLDHRPRVTTKDEIGVLAKTIDAMGRSLEEAQGAQFEHEKQKHQLQIALEIQSNLFPEKLPSLETCEVEAHYHPGPEVGGDYYDAFLLPDGRLAVMVASASGTGIPAAMVTTMARSFTAAVAEREDSGPAILKSVNRLLSPDLRRGMYVTAVLLIVDPKSGKVEISNAGHNAVIHYKAESKAVEPIHADGIALGFDKGPVFDRSLMPKEVQLEPGDRVVLCTPGVYSVQNHEGVELGEQNFYRLCAREGGKSSSAFVNLMADTLEKYAEAGAIESDITFVTVKRLV